MHAKILFAAVALFTVASAACCVSARGADHRIEVDRCKWSVLSTRDPRPEEVPFEESLSYAPLQAQRNEVWGPDSLRLIVRTTKGYYPHVFLEDRRTGRSRAVIPDGWSNLPSWSPDGKLIACVIRDSVSRLQSLAVTSRRTGRTIVFAEASSVIEYKWSPDASAIAVYGHARATRRITLFWLRAADGHSRPVDTLDVIADYDCSWSPDSKHLAFSRPTVISDREEVVAADLWIAGGEGRAKWCLIESPNQVELRPRWIANRLLRFEAARVSEGVVGTPRSVIAELQFAPSTTGR